MPQRYTLSADALFDFNRGDIGHIRSEGRAELDELADKLKTVNYNRINVIGHTDYLGAESYNQMLSKQRANAVRQYLSARGVDANRIRATGAGESQPVKQCMQSADHQALIDCLAPNRRVEIEVEATNL
ncbi:OmpA family protein [Neisseria montereyensis]|uniref:OmpA family protein n=1 Tax=Neisseria montereyensis TaxID=2973938 RepID=A0ABT2FER6_9NEIS|nr:OmpA family protein [Neisseria montereyensis]MCS4534709.1 OmpA family protein [Neisseria montereyensis]